MCLNACLLSMFRSETCVLHVCELANCFVLFYLVVSHTHTTCVHVCVFVVNSVVVPVLPFTFTK